MGKRIELVITLSMAPHSKAGQTMLKLLEERPDAEAYMVETLQRDYAEHLITGIRVDTVKVNRG